MADKKISALTSASTPLDGTEVLPIVQSSTTKKVANNDLRPKQIQSNATSGILQIVGPTATTTRVMTTPDANFTAARTDAAQSFTGIQSFGNNIDLTDNTAAKVNFATVSSAITNYIQTHSDGYSLMLYVDRGLSKPSYLMNYGGTHEWGFAGTSSVELDVTNKNLKISTGNLVIGTAGKGIADNSGTQQVYVNTTGVGIGVAPTTNKFEVSGNIKADRYGGQTVTLTNLSTTYVDIYAGNTAYDSTYIIRMTSVAACTCTFILALSFNSGVGIITTTTALSGCTGANNPGTVTMGGDDARTYTFIRDGATGNLQVKASSLATGDTSFVITRIKAG